MWRHPLPTGMWSLENVVLGAQKGSPSLALRKLPSLQHANTYDWVQLPSILLAEGSIGTPTSGTELPPFHPPRPPHIPPNLLWRWRERLEQGLFHLASRFVWWNNLLSTTLNSTQYIPRTLCWKTGIQLIKAVYLALCYSIQYARVMQLWKVTGQRREDANGWTRKAQ